MSETDEIVIADLPLSRRIEMAIEEIKPELVNVSLKQSFLADVSKVYYRKGTAMAKVFVENKKRTGGAGAADLAGEAVIKSIDILEKYNIPRDDAMFLIKKLQAVQNYE